MLLRDFERGDQDAVRALIQNGLRERWGPDFDETANPDTDDLWTHYVAPGGEIVVIEDEGAIVATGTLVETDDGGGRLVRMSVAPDRRREGLARTVVAELVARALARDHEPIRVSTDTPWTEAVALYERCGFVVVYRDAASTRFVFAPDRPTPG